MAFHLKAFRIPARRVAWALLLGGGITLASGAGDEEPETYFDPLPKAGMQDSKARKKAGAGRPAAGKPGGDRPKSDPTPRGSRYAGLEDCAPGFADAAEQALPSVVGVMGVKGMTGRTGSGQALEGLGSGVVAGPRGHVLTSARAVEGARSLRVRFRDGREADAVLVAADGPTDVAVLRVRAEDRVIGAMRPIRFEDSERLRAGEWVVAVGRPYGLGETVAAGIVSSRGLRKAEAGGSGGLLRTDAVLPPGGIGGALVDLDGGLAGLITSRVSRAGGSGIGYAVPSNRVRGVMEDLLRDGRAARAWLGAAVVDAANEVKAADAGAGSGSPGTARRGARVESVVRDGPADKAGLRRGDVITALDGRGVEDAAALLDRVGAVRPGSVLALAVLRSGKRVEMKVRLGRRAGPAPARGGTGSPADGAEEGEGRTKAGPRLGMGVAKADAALRKRYGLEKDDDGLLVVTSLDRDGAAREAGVRVGDLVLEADGREVSGAADLREAAAAAVRRSGDGTVTLRLRRNGGEMSVDIRLDPEPA